MTEKAQREPLWRRWVVKPLVSQITQGVDPKKIALAIAFGVTTGLFPLLGLTTVVSLAIGIPMKLNQPVLQLFRELTYPLHLATLLLFMRAGEALFGAPHVPLSIPMLVERFYAGPGQFFADFGMIGLYAVTVWALLAPLLITVICFTTRPLVAGLARRLQAARKVVA